MKISDEVVQKIINGAIGVMPTDTIYGVVASVRYPAVIDRIYELKDRLKTKPFVILVSNTKQLKELKIDTNKDQSSALDDLWPGPNSVILQSDESMRYIHLGLNSLAVRQPKAKWLRDLIDQTGPIVATSANISGQEYVGDIIVIKSKLQNLDFYIEGPTSTKPSRLIRLLEDGTIQELPR